MKKFRMMLPVLAVIFAIVGAVGGDLLPITQGYYKIAGSTCSTSTLPLDQDDCFVSEDDQYPICTVTADGVPKQAYQNSGCSNILRHD